MKLVKTEDAVGHVLVPRHDPDYPRRHQGARFRKGHVVAEEDIPVLLSMGKEHLYVWRRSRGCSTRTRGRTACALCVRVRTMSATLPKEGKIELRAECDGLFRVDVERLYAVNSQEELMIATRHTNTPVKKGDKLAGMRVIPLVIAEEKVQAAEAAVGAGGPILSLHPYVCKTCGLVVTGARCKRA